MKDSAKMETINYGEKLQAALRSLIIATLVLYLGLAGTGFYLFNDASQTRSDLKGVATDTRQALCSIQKNIEDRIEASEDFLAKNPKGINGITPKIIKQGIAESEGTLKALDQLDCPR